MDLVNGVVVEPAVEIIHPEGDGPFIVVCEHASNRIPPELGTLGLAPDLLTSHIAWDKGAFPVAVLMAKALDSPLVASRISRLVYDCNRPPDAADAIPAVSEVYEIPGNWGLTPADREARAAIAYEPFRNTLKAVIDRRMAQGRPPILLTIHSFTPVFKGVPRTVALGVLHDVDRRFADALLRVLAADDGLVVRCNEPYGPADGVMHTLQTEAIPRGLLNAMIEIRNDLIADESGQMAMAQFLCRRVVEAMAAFGLAKPLL